MASDEPIELLKQTRMRRRFGENGQGQWTVAYSTWRDDRGNGAQFSAFSDPHRRDRAIARATWDFDLSKGLPCFSQTYGGGAPLTRYHRFGSDDGLEPLVILQEHFGGLPEMLPQIAEEFRLYHNLWISPDGKQLVKLNDDGTQYVAAEVSAEQVRIRTSLLRQFQAGRQVDLLLFIDSIRFVTDLPEPDECDFEALAEEIAQPDARVDFSAHRRTIGGGRGPFSRLLGTRVLAPPEQGHAGIWPFDEAERQHFPDFIIGENENGQPVRHTCDPESLANDFGKNPDEPLYLTPVFFRRDVLLRYYETPEKYTVSDGHLSCASLWGVQIDNDHPAFVMVFLGDLGRDIPESERDHWRSQNVAPTSRMSETTFRRSFLNQASWPQSPDFRFKYQYEKLRADWKSSFGWELFREPVAEDDHVLKRLRVPLNESQPEFEGQVLNLAKVLVDSLNEAELTARLASTVKNEKGIGKLKRWLDLEGYPHVDADVAVLQKVQRLRSRAAAHRKGSDYATFVTAELSNEGPIWGFARLLVGCVEMLERLRWHFIGSGADDDDQ